MSYLIGSHMTVHSLKSIIVIHNKCSSALSRAIIWPQIVQNIFYVYKTWYLLEFISFVTFSSIAWELQLWWVVITCQMCTLESTSILCAFSSIRINHSPLNNGRMWVSEHNTYTLCGFDGKSETLYCLTLASSLVKSINLNTFMELPSS